jgi:predicted nucleic acid-binding protein
MRLYLDANVIIYTVEANKDFQAAVLAWLKKCEAVAGLLITSRLSLLECRPKPLREGDQKTLTRFDDFFAGDNLVLFDISSDVIDQATELRSKYNFRSADAIHLATAILIGADVFLSGDPKLERCAEIRVVPPTTTPSP